MLLHLWSDVLIFSKVVGECTDEKHLEVRCDSIHEWISVEIESSGEGNPSTPSSTVLPFGRLLTSVGSGKASKVPMMNEVMSFGRGNVLNEEGS